MSKDWIQFDHGLWNKPEVIDIAEATGTPEAAICGYLAKFWCWFDAETEDGFAKNKTIKWLDRYLDFKGLSELIIHVGWLERTESGLQIPPEQWEMRFSQSAKRRALAARRKQMSRSRHTFVTRARDENVTIEREVDIERDVPLAQSALLKGIGTSESETTAHSCSNPPPHGVSFERAFASFWDSVPRKVGKKNARAAYERAVKHYAKTAGLSLNESIDAINEAMHAFAAAPMGQGQFCPYPATWLNQGRYEDDQAEWQKGDQTSKKPLSVRDVLNRLPKEESGDQF